LRTPALFVHGTADPFGTVEELRAAMTTIPAHTDLLVVEGAGHDLKSAPAAGILARFRGLVCYPEK
jgi:predicted alpha/beta-hydrolase family hydrolase